MTLGKKYNLTKALEKLDCLPRSTESKEDAMKNEVFYAYTTGISAEKATDDIKNSKLCEGIKVKLYKHIEEIKKYRRACNDRR